MTADVGVLIVHGMGSQDAAFSDGLKRRLQGHLRQLDRDVRRVAWQPGYWAAELEERERRLWRDLALDELRWDALRRFVVSALGDALAYQPLPDGQGEVYAEVQGKIKTSLRELRKKLGDADKPLVVIAHSLGCQVVSTYAWDARHHVEPSNVGDTPFERLETMTSLVTAGCNIPLFTLADGNPVAIDFPPAELPGALKEIAKWLNFYDRDDVLAYPLKGLSPSYARAVTEDIEINAGAPIASFTPLAHRSYWEDDSFTKPVAEVIAEVLDAV